MAFLGLLYLPPGLKRPVTKQSHTDFAHFTSLIAGARKPTPQVPPHTGTVTNFPAFRPPKQVAAELVSADIREDYPAVAVPPSVTKTVSDQVRISQLLPEAMPMTRGEARLATKAAPIVREMVPEAARMGQKIKAAVQEARDTGKPIAPAVQDSLYAMRVITAQEVPTTVPEVETVQRRTIAPKVSPAVGPVNLVRRFARALNTPVWP